MARMHSAGSVLSAFCFILRTLIPNRSIVHGDLTDSNIVVREDDDEMKQRSAVAALDAGLSTLSAEPAARAVDLFVLQNAILSEHPHAEEVVRDSQAKRLFATCLHCADCCLDRCVPAKLGAVA